MSTPSHMLRRLTGALTLLALLAAAGLAQAGRPMLLDDAELNEAGAGHLEAWFERAPGGARQWTLAPAYAPIEGLELALGLTRERGTHDSLGRLQAKWRLGEAAAGACQHAALFALARAEGQSRLAPTLAGLTSCALGPGTLHLNLGAARAPGERTAPFAGLAWEQPLGFASAHLEWIATRRARPIVNLGLKREIAPGLQLDGSLGRSGGQTLLSVGLKQQF